MGSGGGLRGGLLAVAGGDNGRAPGSGRRTGRLRDERRAGGGVAFASGGRDFSHGGIGGFFGRRDPESDGTGARSGENLEPGGRDHDSAGTSGEGDRFAAGVVSEGADRRLEIRAGRRTGGGAGRRAEAAGGGSDGWVRGERIGVWAGLWAGAWAGRFADGFRQQSGVGRGFG